MEVQKDPRPPNGLLHARRKAPTLLPSTKNADTQQQQLPRISLDSAADQSGSTLSPFHTPTSPTFLPQSGLAPRPPSFPYQAQKPWREVHSTSVSRHPNGEHQDRPTTSWGPSAITGIPSINSREHSKSFAARAKAFSVKFEDELLGVGFVTSAQGGQESEIPQGDLPRKLGEKVASRISNTPQKEALPQRSERPTALSQRRLGSLQEQASSDELQRHPYSRSVSAPISRSQRREWAPDRSPLQKLELTLRDITKEEKRAHLEEAELLAREARSGRATRRINRGTGSSPLTRSTTLGGQTSDPLVEAGLVRNLSSKQRNRIQRSATIDTRSPTTTAQPLGDIVRDVFEYQERQYREDPDPDSTAPPIPTGGTKLHGSTIQSIARNRSEVRPPLATESKSPTNSEQGNRKLQSSTMGDQRTKEATSNRRTSSDARILSSPNAMASARPECPSGHSAATNTETDTGTDTKDGRTAALSGTDGYARRRSLSLDSSQNAIGQNQNLSGRRGQTQRGRDLGRAEKASSVRLRKTEEGGAVGTIRLMATDIDLKPKTKRDDSFRDKAWWEGGGSAKATRSGGSRRRGLVSQGMWQSADDAEENGTQSSDQLSGPDSFVVHLPEMSWRKNWLLPTRRYTGHQSTPNTMGGVGWRNRQWFSYLFTSKPQMEPTSFSAAATSPWSYSCPHLSEHDIFHPFHVCPPSSDKELTRSMRSIRVRPVAVPTSFTPALYLKCGPLLRYLGIHQRWDSGPSTSADSAAARREIWRGSVMIVTTDSDSTYEPAPTLRLFSQPMALVPTPPVGTDTPGPELPSEYVDHIAGLPKLSRTGGNIYVKPVEHLEEEKDLSRIENDEGLFEGTRNPADVNDHGNDGGPSRQSPLPTHRRIEQPDGEKLGKFKEVKGVRLHAENGTTFWRFLLEVELGQQQTRIAYRINRGPAIGFWVPAKGETMNIMFHSCNGFSLNVNPDQFNGPDPLWRDVLNAHQTRPFHVMIGGGDQIYNDSVGKQTSLFQSWLAMRNPIHKRSADFTTEMQDELETYYLERYSMWFSQGLFGMAASQIPMINIWDDHDIIDGFGSYPHHFMASQVFSALGTVAFKYYMLFQHQSLSRETSVHEPSWLLGASPGPYINELSRSIFVFLGMKVAFLGLDCRTERMRDEILSDETYSLVFDRCRREIVKGETKHLIVLLGVPIAYPRLVWLENVLTSKILDPVKALGRSGILGGFTNKLDGGVEILDDLDDHWTAKNHKAERNWLIQQLQHLAAEKSVRITILSGDVHQAAVGQFYSNPKLGMAKDKDHRYMPNVISSAIVNAPPPEVLSDVLNKRNKVHHLDVNTDEDMIPMFTHDVDGKMRNNKRLLPRRNWCSIREFNPGTTPPPTPPTPGPVTPEQQFRPTGAIRRSMSMSRKDIRPGQLLRRISRRRTYVEEASVVNTEDEGGAIPPPSNSADNYFPPQNPTSPENGTTRPNPFHRQTTDFLEKKKGSAPNQGMIDLTDGLDIALNVEVNRKDPAGITMPYRLLVPALWYEGPLEEQEEESRERRKSSWFNWRGSIFRPSTTTADDHAVRQTDKEEGRDENVDRDYDEEDEDEDESAEVIMYPPPQREEMIAADPKRRRTGRIANQQPSTGMETGNMF